MPVMVIDPAAYIAPLRPNDPSAFTNHKVDMRSSHSCSAVSGRNCFDNQSVYLSTRCANADCASDMTRNAELPIVAAAFKDDKMRSFGTAAVANALDTKSRVMDRTSFND